MERAKYFEPILTNLNILRYIIYSKVNLGLFDTNKKVEDFYKDILNMVYGWDLKNKNEEKKNYPGIDLSSVTYKVGVQVTSQRGHGKVDRTLELFDKHCLTELDRVIVFNITKKSSHSKEFTSIVSFDKENDILDIDDILTEIEKKSTPDLKKISDYISQEIPYYIGRITSESDLLSHRADYNGIKSRNGKRVLSLSNNEEHLADFQDDLAEVYEKLDGLSSKERKGLFVFYSKCNQYLELRVSTWFDVMKDSFGIDTIEARSVGLAIEEAGIFYNNDEEFNPFFVTHNEYFWRNILALLGRQNVLHDFIVNRNFSLVDE